MDAAVTLEIRRGHLKWSISELARSSRISRTLIYYYFGRSKLGIVLEAVELFGRELAGETESRTGAWKAGAMAETFIESRKILAQVPALVPFYLLNRQSETEVGKKIRSKESAFLKKIRSFFPGASEDELKALFSLFFGLSFSPLLSDEGVRRACAKIIH